MTSIERATCQFVFLTLGLGLTVVTGCAQPQDDPGAQAVIASQPSVDATVVLATTEASELTRLADVDSSRESNGENALDIIGVKDGDAAKPTVADYQAPFPDRIDLFIPPKRQGGVRVEGESGDAVDLLGFIRLDRQQAVLSINGQVTQVAEGASQDGVEVISIKPPNVVLQRGRQRWQDSLDN